MSADSHHLQWVIRATFLQGRFCLCAKWWQISGIMPWRHTSASLIRVTCVSKKIMSAHLERKCMGACKSAALFETNNNKFIFGLAFHGFVGCKPHQKPSLMPFFFFFPPSPPALLRQRQSGEVESGSLFNICTWRFVERRTEAFHLRLGIHQNTRLHLASQTWSWTSHNCIRPDWTVSFFFFETPGEVFPVVNTFLDPRTKSANNSGWCFKGRFEDLRQFVADWDLQCY